MKKIIWVVLSITGFIFLYVIFLKYTISNTFVKKDIDALNLEYSYSDEEFEKVCKNMSRFSYVKGLTDGAFGIPMGGKTYYYKSRCYQDLARRTTNNIFCKKVIQRRSFIYNGSSVSEKSCLDEVKKIQESLSSAQKDVDQFKKTAEGAFEIINSENKVEKISADSWKISVTVKGSLFGEYDFRIIHSDVPLEDWDTLGLLASEEIVIKDQKKSFSWIIARDQLDKIFDPKVNPRQIHHIAIKLFLKKSDEGINFDPEHLTSIGNADIYTGN